MDALATAVDEVCGQCAGLMLRLGNSLDDLAVHILRLRTRWQPFSNRFDVYEDALRDARPNERTLTIQCIDCRIRGLPESVFNCRTLGAVPLAASVGTAIALLKPDNIHVQAHTNCAWLKAVQRGRAQEEALEEANARVDAQANARAGAAEETRQILGDLEGLDLDDIEVVRGLASKMRRHVLSLVDETKTNVTASAMQV